MTRSNAKKDFLREFRVSILLVLQNATFEPGKQTYYTRTNMFAQRRIKKARIGVPSKNEKEYQKCQEKA